MPDGRIPTVILTGTMDDYETILRFTPDELRQWTTIEHIRLADGQAQRLKKFETEFPFRVAEQVFHFRRWTAPLSSEQADFAMKLLAAQERGEPLPYKALKEFWSIGTAYKKVSQLNAAIRAAKCRFRAGKHWAGITCVPLEESGE